jgi:DNA polymerase-1
MSSYANRPLPNVRKLFKPDPGHIICDVDLSGADAQVVAWEAGDRDLKAAFRAGLDIHNHNGATLWGERYSPEAKPRKYTMRDELKRAVHGTNYAAGPRNLSSVLGWTQLEVRNFQNAWFNLHPGIREWHARTERDLQLTRSVRNRFGYRIVYFDRPNNLLPKGLAWLPQSTIAAVCSKAAVKLSRSLPWCDLLLQVHDSIVFQIPRHRNSPSAFRAIRSALECPIPYEDPLTIPWGLALSERSWGEVEKKKWEEVA